VFGRAHVPQHANFLVAANHASHLDMGLVKHALGDQGENLVALAATDYFFSNKYRRAFFENFTSLIPMNRHGSLRESLELASKSLKQGRNLLIFPEGTRATDGTLKDFKGSLGYLALTNKVGILPVYLDGTYEALPKGAVVPKTRELAAHIGPFLSYEELEAAVSGLPRSEQHREIARRVEAAVRALEDGCRGPRHTASVTPISPGDGTAEPGSGAQPRRSVGRAGDTRTAGPRAAENQDERHRGNLESGDEASPSRSRAGESRDERHGGDLEAGDEAAASRATAKRAGRRTRKETP
ncbi:MAG TPA: 1-acyl-sn-glycerol-3-phosphate acyltransferase, partial [Vulgatibacter sp.]